MIIHFTMFFFKSQEREIIFFFLMRKKHILGIGEYFANTSRLTNIIPIPIRNFWDLKTIPIPICTEVGSMNLLLFLFAGEKKTIR